MKRLIFVLIIGVSISCNNQKKENNNINKPEDSTVDYSVLDCSSYIVSGNYATGYEQGYLSKNDYDAKTNRDCENGIEVMNKLRRMSGIGEYYPTNVYEYKRKDCYCKGFYDGYDGNPQLHFE